MAQSYFIIEKGIIERTDLSIYEKMCCVVLAKWASESRPFFDMATLADQMSCDEYTARATIKQLKLKGLISSEEEVSSQYAIPRIIKAEAVSGLDPITYSDTALISVETRAKKLSKEEMIEKVRDILEESINDSEARIILNFADDDLDKIEACYRKARQQPVSDKVEALMMELQRKEAPLRSVSETVEVVEKPLIQEVVEAPFEEKASTLATASEEKSDKPWYLDEDVDDIIKPPSGNQINTNMLNKMRAYGKMRK